MQSTNFANATPPAFGPPGFGDKRAPAFPMPGPMMGQQPNFQVPMFPTGALPMGMPGMPGMGQMPMGMFPMGSRKNQAKETEFAKGLYVYDFEESMTGEMLFKHFNEIKPVSVIKFPTTKQRFSKKFAFVYFKSPADVAEVKRVVEEDRDEEEKAIREKRPQVEIDKLKKRHRIIKKAIRIAPLAINDESKLILKPKYDKNAPNAKEVLKKIQDEYFNVKKLEEEIKRIVKVNQDYRFNKVVIPKDPKDGSQDVPYARAYFDLYMRNQIEEIKDLLDKDEEFKKRVDAMTYKPLYPNNSNMLYVKGLLKIGEPSDPELNEELRATF